MHTDTRRVRVWTKPKDLTWNCCFRRVSPCFFRDFTKNSQKIVRKVSKFQAFDKNGRILSKLSKICCQFSKFRDFFGKIWKCRRSSHKSMIFRLNFMLKLCVNVCLRLNFNKKPHFTENEGFLLQISTQNRFNRNFEHNFNKNRKFKFKISGNSIIFFLIQQKCWIPPPFRGFSQKPLRI